MKTEAQKAWAKAVNDHSNWSYKDPVYGNKVQGELRSVHYLIYNIVRGLPLDRGFTRNEYFEQLVRRVENMFERSTIGSGYNKAGADTFIRSEYLKHFAETVTVDEFVEKANDTLRLYRCS